MKTSQPTTYFLLNILALLALAADQLLKIYFLANPALSLGGSFFYGLVKFNLATNSGIAFGLPVSPAIVWFLTLVVILVLLYELGKAYQASNLVLISSLTFILSGAASNLIDRLRYGLVIDYIDLKYFTVFNLADSFITLGALMLLWFLVKQYKKLSLR